MLQEDTSIVPVRSFFVRKRNALLVRAHFSPLFMDYYLHLMQHGLRNDKDADHRMKDILSALTLHLCSRPQDEVVAWTINVRHPLMNLFATGGSRPTGRVTGRVFVEDVKDSGKNLFIAQVNRGLEVGRQSMVDFDGMDILEAVEHFYTQSEQRITRFFRLEDEELVMVSAEPDCDEEWLLGLELDDLLVISEKEHLTPLETRAYKFECGCSVERLYPLIARLSEDDLDHVFSDGVAVIHCPRCSAVFKAPREHFDEWRVANKKTEDEEKITDEEPTKDEG